MKQRKIFIGIQLPEQVKKRLIMATEKWRDLPVRWSLMDNLHITLLFIGHISDEAILDICEKARMAAKKAYGLDIKFDKIILGPDKKNPKIFWLSGKADGNLKNLVESLEKKLGLFKISRKEYRPHITLGRIRKEKWDALPAIPEIEEKFSVSVPASEIIIFESALEKGKRRFIPIESCPLG